MVGTLSSTPSLRSLPCAASMLRWGCQVTFGALQEASHQNPSDLTETQGDQRMSRLHSRSYLPPYCSCNFLQEFFWLALRSPRERWQSLGKRNGEVGAGLEGTCTPVAANLMLPFLGRAATGGTEVRGNRHASEDGPLHKKKKKMLHAEL